MANDNNMKVVDTGCKVDLHIHSVFSREKDKGKVAFNTLENIGVLADKLDENGVQICAITDHDAFSYEIYHALKQYENDDNFSIIKVFPGVEFSVEYEGDKGTTKLHVIAIFNDEDDSKVKSIANSFVDGNGKAKYDRKSAFSEEKFIAILRKIELDTVLIVHQKRSLTSENPSKNDAKTVGDDRFIEFVYTDYFEAFEFKNRKNEVFNKSFLTKQNLTKDIRFVTGSDCHDWRYYPKEHRNDKVEFTFTYMKCLPTFRGMVMAITDHRRIKTVNSFFNPTETYTKSLEIKIDDCEYDIPLSRGINVIIGDNSVGKSLLLHKMTDYRKQQEKGLTSQVVSGYNKYLKKHKIEIETIIPASEVFHFDMQGEIREKFEQKTIKSDDFLKRYYPPAIETDAYREKIQRKLNTIYAYLEEKYAIEKMESQLGRFKILDEDIEHAESLSFIGQVQKDNKKVSGYAGVSSGLNNIVEKIETIFDNRYLEEEDKNHLMNINKQLREISAKYEDMKKITEKENTKIALYQAAVSKFKQNWSMSISDIQKKLSTYNENVDAATDAIASIIARKNQLREPDFKIDKEKIQVLTERVHDYSFMVITTRGLWML